MELNEFVFGQIVESAWSGDDDVGSFAGVFDFGLVFFERDSSEVATISQFGFLKIAT